MLIYGVSPPRFDCLLPDNYYTQCLSQCCRFNRYLKCHLKVGLQFLSINDSRSRWHRVSKWQFRIGMVCMSYRSFMSTYQSPTHLVNIREASGQQQVRCGEQLISPLKKFVHGYKVYLTVTAGQHYTPTQYSIAFLAVLHTCQIGLHAVRLLQYSQHCIPIRNNQVCVASRRAAAETFSNCQ